MKRILALGLLVLAGCTDEQGATKALREAGLKPVSVGGYALFSCASGKDGDTFATKFTATNVNGQTVTGAVCSGWLKGKTIRFD